MSNSTKGRRPTTPAGGGNPEGFPMGYGNASPAKSRDLSGYSGPNALGLNVKAIPVSSVSGPASDGDGQSVSIRCPLKCWILANAVDRKQDIIKVPDKYKVELYETFDTDPQFVTIFIKYVGSKDAKRALTDALNDLKKQTDIYKTRTTHYVEITHIRNKLETGSLKVTRDIKVSDCLKGRLYLLGANDSILQRAISKYPRAEIIEPMETSKATTKGIQEDSTEKQMKEVKDYVWQYMMEVRPDGFDAESQLKECSMTMDIAVKECGKIFLFWSPTREKQIAEKRAALFEIADHLDSNLDRKRIKIDVDNDEITTVIEKEKRNDILVQYSDSGKVATIIGPQHKVTQLIGTLKKIPAEAKISKKSPGKSVKRSATPPRPRDADATGTPTRGTGEPEKSVHVKSDHSMKREKVTRKSDIFLDEKKGAESTVTDHSEAAKEEEVKPLPPKSKKEADSSTQIKKAIVKLPDISSDMTVRWNNRTDIIVKKADITKIRVDAIVNAANERLAHAGGVARAIASAAGQRLEWECDERVRKRGPLHVSEVYVSGGYNLPVKYVLHAVGPIWRHYKDKRECANLLFRAFQNCLQEAESKSDVRSIAIPAVSSGIYAVPLDIVATEMHAAVTEHLNTETNTSIREIHLVDINEEYLGMLKAMFESSVEADLNLRDDNKEQNHMGSDDDTPDGTVRGVARGSAVIPDGTTCSICMDDVTKPARLKCGHVFCGECIDQWKQQKPTCPQCGDIFGEIKGNQPKDGRMREERSRHILPGFERNSRGTITIYYDFPSGKQGAQHPNPGKKYDGTRRKAYLPDNKEGNLVLSLLRKAFSKRLVFTVGRSTTSNRDDQITWNDIHHKTHWDGGPDNYGYPDPTYLSRVREELAAKGIK